MPLGGRQRLAVLEVECCLEIDSAITGVAGEWATSQGVSFPEQGRAQVADGGSQIDVVEEVAGSSAEGEAVTPVCCCA